MDKPYLIYPACLQEQDRVYLEAYNHGSGEYCVIPCVVKWIEEDGMCLLDKYGAGHYCKNGDHNMGWPRATFGWRCWDAPPSKERREAVPWSV